MFFLRKSAVTRGLMSSGIIRPSTGCQNVQL